MYHSQKASDIYLDDEEVVDVDMIMESYDPEDDEEFGAALQAKKGRKNVKTRY